MNKTIGEFSMFSNIPVRKREVFLLTSVRQFPMLFEIYLSKEFRLTLFDKHNDFNSPDALWTASKKSLSDYFW